MTFYEALLGIEIQDEFGIYEESDELTPNADLYVTKVFHLAKEMNIPIEYHYGASQLCFIIPGEDRVIKLPFDGQMEEWEDYNEETEEYDIWQESFHNFEIDYTAKTYDIYTLAVEAGVEEFFADIDILGLNFNNQLIYTQKYVKPRAEQTTSKHPSEGSLRIARSLKQEKYIPFESDWIAVCIDMYGEEKFNKLMSFINELNLNDFHTNNYGYTKDGKPMLLDYCGY